MPDLRTVHAKGPWQVDLAPGGGPDLVIAFASIGHDPARMPSPEFVGSASARGRRALFVMDQSRSWATDPGFVPALKAGLAAAGPAARILCIGSSMGAVAALCAAPVVNACATLAFGPQSDLTDPRWHALTRDLPRPPLPPPHGWTVLFHGLANDAAQAAGFAQSAGTDHLLFPDLAHSDLTAWLKSRGLLQGLIDSALATDRRRLLRIAAGAGAFQRRKQGKP